MQPQRLATWAFIALNSSFLKTHASDLHEVIFVQLFAGELVNFRGDHRLRFLPVHFGSEACFLSQPKPSVQ